MANYIHNSLTLKGMIAQFNLSYICENMCWLTQEIINKTNKINFFSWISTQVNGVFETYHQKSVSLKEAKLSLHQFDGFRQLSTHYYFKSWDRFDKYFLLNLWSVVITVDHFSLTTLRSDKKSFALLKHCQHNSVNRLFITFIFCRNIIWKILKIFLLP